ncbi:MAG: quinone-dependent dihydroorotate dehydrogenase [Candidatus Doudnabacteria bacterium CG10_big_fil_rev_8_21_14_0_10_41_10]|uniref:Dihydroorotate dehydrogenase (quinone) n=1 Tax=Candidatus Doudnabacteria bacterium CG10_big_fil_rev_8_21_14_0_10_41_10 TaxID=1974551 RepID=A0A2H0VE00_9BACT|nr:MAG: quinone-dependent dihydroorotate dehydrogenase [Candidatus Doudnabacteria bacterium CG10_big_fil_rev_8_21_14_0_10_41_10]
MKSFFVVVRNTIVKFFYKTVFKQIFFLMDPELVHSRAIKIGTILGASFLTRSFITLCFSYSNKILEREILKIKFLNPVGLAAGFDKNAQLTALWPSVGFGFAEVGSITGEACEGNPKPRLWRLKKSQSLVVNYGLKNEGSEKLSAKLRNIKFQIPIGTSIAKTNNKETVETEQGIADYVKAFKQFSDIGSYFSINISCPNVFGGLPFTDDSKLDKLLGKLDQISTGKPIFIKISPDLSLDQVDKIIDVVKRHRVDGFICSNLTKNRVNKKIIDNKIPEAGGISGRAVEDLANNLIGHIYRREKDRFVIIGCGGVFRAEDAYKKIKLGASLVQLITGMIYEGPQVISEINMGLVKLLKKDGFTNISQAVGSGVK